MLVDFGATPGTVVIAKLDSPAFYAPSPPGFLFDATATVAVRSVSVLFDLNVCLGPRDRL